MAFQKVVNTASISVIYTANGEFVQNQFYAEHPSGYDLAALVSLADTIDSTIAADWLGDQVAEAIYIRTEVRGLEFENDLVATDGDSSGPGSHISAPLPNNVTLAIKKESGLTGRSARGRTFWIGAPRTELEGTNENLFTATYVADVVTNIDKIRIAISNVVPWQPVLVSRFANNVPRTEGKTFPWIKSSSVNTIVDSQRGRLPG